MRNNVLTTFFHITPSPITGGRIIPQSRNWLYCGNYNGARYKIKLDTPKKLQGGQEVKLMWAIIHINIPEGDFCYGKSVRWLNKNLQSFVKRNINYSIVRSYQYEDNWRLVINCFKPDEFTKNSKVSNTFHTYCKALKNINEFDGNVQQYLNSTLYN